MNKKSRQVVQIQKLIFHRETSLLSTQDFTFETEEIKLLKEFVLPASL